MVTTRVNIDSMDKIRGFVNIMNRHNTRCMLVSGCSQVNAKSIMGIFSLDISKPVDLNIYAESADGILSEISQYLI